MTVSGPALGVNKRLVDFSLPGVSLGRMRIDEDRIVQKPCYM